MLPLLKKIIVQLKIKKQRNHTLKKPQKVKLPTITFNDDDSASLADFKPLAPPKMMKEPHMGKEMEQDTNINNNFIHEGFGNDENYVSEYPQNILKTNV